MPKRKFTEAEIIGTIHQVNAGQTCIEVVREVGVSKHTLLCLEGEVRRSERERGAPAAPTGRREPAAEAVGGGVELGQRDVAVGAQKTAGARQPPPSSAPARGVTLSSPII